MKLPIDWLLSGPAFVRYSTPIDLCGDSRTCSAVKRACADMRADARG